MKIFFIIIGCILLYIIGFFITLVMEFYIQRKEYKSSNAYNYIDDIDIIMPAIIWPIYIWFIAFYLLFLKLKKYTKAIAIAITEILYQINNKEDKEDKNDN